MSNTDKKSFLKEEVVKLLNQLDPAAEPTFGVMTPQHMAEHLSLLAKSSVKRYGEPEDPPTEGQLSFQRFIAKGAILKHRPGKKTRAELDPPKFDSYDEAIRQVQVGIDRFYDHFEAHPEFKSYLPFWGELGFEQLEQFHYSHFRYHLWQFGLLESYP